MEKYNYEIGMCLIVTEMEKTIPKIINLYPEDTALMLDYKATVEELFNITAKLVYALLYNRAIDRKTAETDGKIYVIFTIRELSGYIGKSEMTVKNSLKILEEKGLIKRKSVGVGKLTHIFILYPNGSK